MSKNRKEFESWAQKELEKWQQKLLLNDHTLSPIEKSDDNSSKCVLRYPYKDIEIKYSEYVFECWKKRKKNEATSILIHELCHVFTDPFYCKATSRYISKDDMEDERERLVDHITNIVTKNIV